MNERVPPETLSAPVTVGASVAPDAPVTVSAQTAIMLVNQAQMETQLWRYALGASKVPLVLQVVLAVLGAQTFSHEGTAQTMLTYKGVALWLSKSLGAAERILRRYENEYFTQKQNDERGNIHHWLLKNTRVAAALAQFAEGKVIILQVVATQYAQPDNPKAGMDLLPDNLKHVYFNIVANRQARLAGKQPEQPK